MSQEDPPSPAPNSLCSPAAQPSTDGFDTNANTWDPSTKPDVVEILPYNLRARGLVLYNFFVALALIFNQYANPIGVENAGWKFYITYDVWLLVELVVVYFLFVETGKLSLEETAAVIDGEEMQNKLAEEVIRKTEKDLGLTRVETVPEQ